VASATLLYPVEDISARVAELGAAISRDYAGKEPVIVSVLKGSSLFVADLVRNIALPIRMDFMSISSFGDSAEKSGRVRIVKDLDQDIGGRDVILVEDIVDTGLTATYLISALSSRSPASLEICALLDKSVRRIAPLQVRYRGFDCPDRFVIGYGMDVGERYRNLPGIWGVDDVKALRDDPDSLVGLIAESVLPADTTLTTVGVETKEGNR
jgi:hypoxanthine phosphoribosyltransferase